MANADRIMVGTRKGLFELRRNEGWRVTTRHFLGEPVSMVMVDPRDDTVYAALNLGHFGAKLWRRESGASEWSACGVPVYPPQPEGEHGKSLQLIWSLEAGGPEEPGVLWAGTIPGGLFRSNDKGESWALNVPLWARPERAEWFGGGYDQPGIHSICVDPRDSRHLSIAVSCGGVWQTHDGGNEWAPTCQGMYADYMPPERREDPVVQDPHRMVQCPSDPDTLWVQHHCGIYRSIDGGARWMRVFAQPSSFGFAVAVHPHLPDTTWFVPSVKDECRVPVDDRFVVTRTDDSGASFATLSNGLPEGHAYDLVYRHGLDVDETGECLAMGSTTGALWLTEDGGLHWRCLSAHLPPIYAVRFG
ncbi:WD40/YVTN/BNR-like repeat-containing protein [Uliginosibacterium sp. sgz301328]|uniref:WD40/YVTN/BNR-like repeat-containing protein n=1 Tax=Uliginosibacterium sp. sgz301328 TaxID=3243764 RepID=UPI00359F0B4D